MAFEIGRIFATIGLIAGLAFILVFGSSLFLPNLGKHIGATLDKAVVLILFASFFAMLVSAIGTSLIVLLGWREERLQLKREIERLESQLAQSVQISN